LTWRTLLRPRHCAEPQSLSPQLSTLETITHYLGHVWQWFLILLWIIVFPFAVGHVVLRQRDSRIAAFWAAIIAFIPLIGALWYAMFGINRIERHGKKYRAAMDLEKTAAGEACPVNPWASVPELRELHSFGAS